MPVKKAATAAKPAAAKKAPAAKVAAPKTGAKKALETPRLEDFINEVKGRAFEIYLRRVEKGQPGDEIGDWSTAEKEVKAKYSIK